MKTFTNYAEKKAKQFLNLLQGYTKGIRMTAILILLLTGVSNAWADIAFSGGYIYFDNSIGINQTYIQLCARQSSWTGVSTMTNISNTKLYYVANPQGSGWGGILGWVVIGNSSQKTNSNFDNWSAYGWCSAWNTYGFNSGSTYLIVPTSTSKSQSVNTSCLSGGYSALNSQQAIKSAVNGADANSKATISITSYKMTGNGQVTAQTATLGTGAKDTYVDAARTATTTLTVGDVATGYQFDGWFAAKTGGTALSTSATYIYYPTAATTVYARFSAKKYTITYKDQGGSNFSGTHESGYPTTHTYGTATTLKTASKTGYTFEGWYKESACTNKVTSLGENAYTANITLYAKWTPKNYTITLNANGGASNGSATATYNSSTITNLTHPTRTDYRCNGYYTATSGGTLVLNIDGTLAKNVSGYTDANGNWTKDGNATLYAQWTHDVTEYTVTFGVGTGSTSYGSLSAYNNSTFATITSPATVRSGQSITFTAEPKTGYVVEGWYTNAACTSGKHDAGSTTYNTSITAVTSVYVKFVEKTWSVDFAASTGGAVSPKETQTVGEANGVTIIATPNKGYTFSGWTSSNGGKFDDSKSEKTTFKPTANSTVTASFTENLYAITVKSSNKDFGTVSPESGSAGIDTKVTITATPKLGYKFVNWTAENGITIADANSKTTTITASAAGTVTANFELIPPTTIHIKSDGNYDDFKWNYNSVAYDMEKVDCDGTYYTADILGGVEEITLTGSNFTTTTLTVPTDDKVLYDLTSTNITHLYLKPNSNWTQSNARFAAYFFGDGEEWVNMTAVAGQSGLYEVTIPTGKSYTSVIFCRMNPSSNTNGWTQNTQLWNQTNDLKIPTDGKNQYAVAAGAWSKGDGTWSTIYDNSKWTTFEAPTLELRINITGKGSIVIDGETYTSESKGTTTLRVSKTNGDSIAIGAITPTDRWAYNNDAEITMCDETIDLAVSHTISGPATINLSFTQTSCEVVFNLNVPKGVVIPSWSIANQYMDINGTATEPTSVGEIGEYLFGGWYKNGSTFTDANKYDFSTPVTGDLILYARWIPYAQCIFFKNNLKWKDVYVYTFSNNVWYDSEDSNTKYGPGVCTKVNVLEFAKMTQIDNTDIYYYILTKQDGFNHIAFSDANMNNWNEFFGNNAVYRSDRSDQMPLFIPQTDQTASTTNSTKYYSSGIWMKYNSTESGYKWSSDKNGWSTDVNPFTASAKGGYTFTTTVSLSGNTKYLFKVNNIRGDWYSKVSTMTQDDCTDWWFQPESDPNKNAVIQPNVTGDYVFTLYLGDGKVELSLEYPLSVGDYRLSYYDAVTGLHPGHYIKKRNENRRDTVSFFVHVENNPEIRLEHCTAIDPSTSTATWEILAQYNVLKTISAHPSTAMSPGRRNADGTIYIGDGCGIDSTGVYNFVLQQSNSQAEADLATDATHKYEGHYYIRTDAAEGGWDSFRQASNQITYSSFADSHSNFNHYYCKYIAAGSNVKFTIANDYSYCISDTLDNDPIIEKGQSSPGCLPINANVRFGWDSNTNEISRAYIKGAGMTSDRFLVLQGKDNNLKDANGDTIPLGTGDRTGLLAHEEILVDQQNWIYQVDVTANKNTEVKLVADYNGTTQYFKGNATEYTRLLSSTAAKEYKIRLVYDFKSNHLITAWMAAGDTIKGEQALGVDMMVIRTNQEKADQLNFNPTSSSLGNVGIGYAVMKFTKAYLENLQEDNKTPLPKNEEKTERERSLYWVSFPFDVKISDVFGFGEYAEHWILQYYDGAERAEKGLFIDSGTYWKYIEDKNTTLQAGTGYVLALDLSKVEFLFGATEVSLYFPSTDSLRTISGGLPTADTIPAHECTIDREFKEDGTTYNHKFTDSHWNLIGVPGFADIDTFNVTSYHFMQDDASFYYNFKFAENKYEVETSQVTKFQAMYAYMVQFAGTINWMSKTVSGVEPQPASIAARRYSDEQPEKVVLRLELAQGEEQADRTFIQLEEEGATAEFDLSRDLTKIINKGANIYTLAGEYSIQTAGNALPMEEAVVPVGVDIATAGEYTFRMPDGTEGMVVELLDYEANTRTNLLLSDYTVTLQKGSNENRFALYIQPSKSGVSTSIENVDEGVNGGEAVMKYLIDGKLFIRTADGMLYDAQGRKL